MKSQTHHRLAYCVIITGLIILPASLSAASYSVTKTDDTADGTCAADCSLREAVIAANASDGDDTIVLPSGTYILTIATTNENASANGDLDINDANNSLTITGAGMTATIIDGNAADRIFDVITSNTLTLNSLTVQNGRQTTEAGGIQNAGTLSLSGVRVTGNVLTTDGGDGGAGILNKSSSTLTITNSVIDVNTSVTGGAGIMNQGTLTVTNSTIANNTTMNTNNDGAGIYSSIGTTTIVNSTLSNNSTAGSGGAITQSTGTLTIVHSTIANNVADSNATSSGGGGGIMIDDTATTFTLRNSVLADNTLGSGSESNCLFSNGASATSGGYNVLDTPLCAGLSGASTDQIAVDALLDSVGLANNGGSSKTIALQATSVAINSIPLSSCTDHTATTLTADQRATSRPQGTKCDAGSYEYVDTTAPTITLTGSSNQTVECVIETYTEAGATASDTVDGNISSSITTSGSVDETAPGQYQLVYTVTDDAGNTASTTRTVTVQDTISPSVNLLGESTIALIAGQSFSDPGASADDDCDTTVSYASTSDVVDTTTSDTYTLTYNASDTSGNVGSASRTVMVTSPVIKQITKNGGNLEITYQDDTTGTLSPFNGRKKFIYTLSIDNKRLLVTDGKVLKVYTAAEKVAQKTVNKTKPKRTSYYRLFSKSIYSDYDAVFFLSATKKTGKIIVFRLVASHALKKKVVKKVPISSRQVISLTVKKSKKQFSTIFGKGKAKLKTTWRLTKKGKVKVF